MIRRGKFITVSVTVCCLFAPNASEHGARATQESSTPRRLLRQSSSVTKKHERCPLHDYSIFCPIADEFTKFRAKW